MTRSPICQRLPAPQAIRPFIQATGRSAPGRERFIRSSRSDSPPHRHGARRPLSVRPRRPYRGAPTGRRKCCGRRRHREGDGAASRSDGRPQSAAQLWSSRRARDGQERLTDFPAARGWARNRLRKALSAWATHAERGVGGTRAGSSRRDPHLVRPVPGSERSQNLVEEARRQKAIVVATRPRRLAQIVAWPDELIALAHDHP